MEHCEIENFTDVNQKKEKKKSWLDTKNGLEYLETRYISVRVLLSCDGHVAQSLLYRLTRMRSFSLGGGEPNLNEVFVIFTLILLCLCRLTLPQFSFTVSAQNLDDLAKEKIFKTYF